MRIIYITNARIPTEKAHGYQISKMCEEFAGLGVEVELLVPRRENFIKESVFDFYGLKKNFKISYLKSFDFIKLDKILGGRLACYLQELAFLFKLFFVKVDKKAFIYSRSPEIAWLFKFRKYKVMYEMHYWPESKQKIFARMIRRVDKFIVITKSLKNILINSGIDAKTILVSPDGVDADRFDIDILKEEARKKLGLPPDKKIVMYVGHLYKWKGADVLARAAKKLDDGVVTVFVGGTDKEIEEFKKKYSAENIIIAGRKKHVEIPYYMKAADVLVLPNVSEEKISSKYTSPLKMFEYMASRRPIVASDLPSIREVLSEDNAVLVKSGSPSKLAKGIKFILTNPDAIKQKISSAFAEVKKYDWATRADSVLKFIRG